MKCTEVSELLVAYLDGELTPGEQQRVESHLTTCALCRQELESSSAVMKQLRPTFEQATRDVVPDLQAWSKIHQCLSMEQPHLSASRCSWVSKLRAGGRKVKEFMFGQPKWKIAVMGALIVGVIVALALILPPSHGKPNTALAANIALNSPEVKAALGGEEVQAVKTTVSEGKGVVVCVADMQPPIIVKVDLKSQKVTEITDAPLPELTEAEAKTAVDIARSDPTVQNMLDKVEEKLGIVLSITSAKAFPCFISGSVETKGGEIKLLPKPRMAIVEFGISGNPLEYNLIRITVDLDAQKVIEAGMYSDHGGMSVRVPSDLGQPFINEEAKIAARGLIEEDLIAKILLKQGFNILDDNIIIIRTDNPLDTEKGVPVVISTPTLAGVWITRGEEKWMAMVDLVQKQVHWDQIPENRIAPIDPAQDKQDRETVLNLIQNDSQAKDLISQGATLYIQLHSGDFEYAPSPETETLVTRARTKATAYLILGDDVWGCDVDLKADKLDGAVEQMPASYLIPAEKKEAVLQVLEAEPKVKELLDGGGQVIVIMGGGDSGDATIDSMAIALIYVERTGDFWNAVVSLNGMTFIDLKIVDY